MERLRLRRLIFITSLPITFVLHIWPAGLNAQNRMPRFEAATCPFAQAVGTANIRVECGQLVVARDRQQLSNGTYRLVVAIVRPKETPTAPPLVMVHGGPSGPGGLRTGEMSQAIRWAPMLKRDIVVYDQRGAGFSEPSLCANVPPARARMQPEATRDERQNAFNAFARDCVASMKAEGIDPDTFNSETNAADLNDLRIALGYPVWDLWGVSYGGRIIQEALRRRLDGIRSVIMGSPEIAGVAFQAEVPLSFQRVLERLFVACEEQPVCAAAFPRLEEDFYRLVAELNAKPIEVTFDRSSGPIAVILDGERFLREVHNNFLRQFARLPLIVRELRTGDRMKAAQLLVADSVISSGGNNVLTDLVLCYDAYGPDYLKAAFSVRDAIKAPFRALVNDAQECPIWHSRFADITDHTLVESDVPALILTTEFDDRSPTDHGRRIAAGLKTAYLFELPGRGHADLGGECPESIISQFLQEPSRKPNAECTKTMKPISVETERLESPTILISITDTASEPNPFLGNWEGSFPGAPVIYTVTLGAAEGTLTGTITTGVQKLQILDGRIEGRTITFRVISPDGNRTITFTGTLNENEISFTRDVVVRPGGPPGGAALFGAAGARSFVTRKIVRF